MSIDRSSQQPLRPSPPTHGAPPPPTLALPVVRISRTPSRRTISTAEKQRDVGFLNQEFHRLGKEGWNHAEIIDTKSATGLGLVARHDILATEDAPFRLCEYEGTWKSIPAQERIAEVPRRDDLMYGVEVSLPTSPTDRTGTQRRWRIVADHPTDNIGRYGNAPDGSSPPNARLVLRKDGRVWVEIISLTRLGEPILLDYGPYYWIHFWHRLPLTAQVQLQQNWRHIPPTHSANSVREAECDYVASALNRTDNMLQAAPGPATDPDPNPSPPAEVPNPPPPLHAQRTMPS
jgi:hypothetical protein